MQTFTLIVGLLALVIGAFLYWRSRQGLSAAEASKIVKRHAEGQKVKISLSNDQMEAIQSQWLEDPNRPAEITFIVEGNPVGEMKVATCPYFGTTCCA